jgi:RNA polymerase sigma factor (TIGR02999 family)
MSLTSEQLLPLVYDELRRLAAARIAKEGDDQTLQPTALVHEAWLRLGDEGRTWEDRAHFYRAAAQAMRRILMDRARNKSRQKRGGGHQRLNIQDLDLGTVAPDERMLLIEESLQLLERENPEAAEIVMLKFFAGLSNKKVAETIRLSEATVERRWAFAKISLFRIIQELNGGPAARE